MIHSKLLVVTQFNPTMETYCTRGCDRIRFAAFVQDSTVTIGVTSDYTPEMLGNRRATLGNKQGMWVNTWEMMVRSARSVNISAKPESSARGMWVNSVEKLD